MTHDSLNYAFSNQSAASSLVEISKMSLKDFLKKDRENEPMNDSSATHSAVNSAVISVNQPPSST
jgi:hypothetical protein